MNEYQAVRDFMLACGQPVPDRPEIPDRAVVDLRIRLIEEEVTELLTLLYRVKSLLNRNTTTTPKSSETTAGIEVMPESELLLLLTRIADNICDVNYVVNGTAVAFGIDGELTFKQVHKANMTKASGPRREDGKILKPPGWQSPEPIISDILRAARA